MKLEITDIVKKEYADKLMPVPEFAREKGVQTQAMTYAIKEDLIDWVELGNRVKMVVMTQKSIDYTPNASSKRDAPKKPKRSRLDL